VINLHMQEVALEGEEALKPPMGTPINLVISNNMPLPKVVISSNITLLKISLINNNMVKSTMHTERNNITRNKTPTTNNLTTLNSSSSLTMSKRIKVISPRPIKSQSSSRLTISSSRSSRLISNLRKVIKININPNISLRVNNKSINLKMSSSSNHTGRLLSTTLLLFSRLTTKKRRSLLSTNRNLKIATIKRRLSTYQHQSNISRQLRNLSQSM
jgi:hypothetical protein